MDRGVHGVSKDGAAKQQQKVYDPWLVESMDAEPWTQRTDCFDQLSQPLDEY